MAADAIIAGLAALLDAKAVVVPPDSADYDRGYRYGAGRSLCVVRPATIDDLRAVVRHCVRHGIAIVPQGANTGLVGASTADASGEQIVLSLERLAGVEALDALDRTATVRAGTRLSSLNAAAADHGLSFPIDLGADPSIGGMIATNTGGARLLRHGDVQRNLLGLEVVLIDEDATLLSDMKGLRKDNSGIDWKQLFVGTGGAFGIVVRAKVELHRLPRQTVTALLVPHRHAAVPAIVDRLEHLLGDLLTACEGMSRNAMDLALEHHPSIRPPFAELPDYALLIELGSTLPADFGLDLEEMLGKALEACFEGDAPLLTDAVVGRGEEIWAVRHAISDGLKREGRVIAFDVAMPRSELPAFRAAALAAVADRFPHLKVCDFGHCGDGGDHFNIVWPFDAAPSDEGYAQAVETLQTLIYDLAVQRHGGTFSAEHGVGPHNIRFYRRYTPSEERALAGKLKAIFDPGRLLGNVDFQ